MGGLRPSGLHLNKPVVFGLIGLALLIFVLSRLYMGGSLLGGVGTSSFYLGAKSAAAKPVGAGRGMDDVVNASRLESLPELTADGLEKKEEQFPVTVGDKALKVHMVQMIKSSVDVSKALTVVFLHGGKFSSQNWLDIKSLDHVANWGYRALAIDLPGKGKTTEELSQELTPEFMEAFVSKLGTRKIVIVSPSMSGRYSLPYLFKDPKTSTERAVGFVPVAPVATQEHRGQYPESQLPTLIVYGTKDIAGATTLNDLMLLPKHEIAPIEDAGHACYLDKPDSFHKVLYHFLQELAGK